MKKINDPERLVELEGRSGAIKWIVVSCFGYQGFSNAKFGRIEFYKAFNAFAREILLDAKEALEAGGWEVVNGIVDNIWVMPRPESEQTSLNTLATKVTDDAGIRLEHEVKYDWVAFVPQRNSDAGALTKYFVSLSDKDEYKYRSIECRQRSTPPFIADIQDSLIEIFDEYRSPEAVCNQLQQGLHQLEAGEIDSEELVIEQLTSKSADEYTHSTRTVAALERVGDSGRELSPNRKSTTWSSTTRNGRVTGFS